MSDANRPLRAGRGKRERTFALVVAALTLILSVPPVEPEDGPLAESSGSEAPTIDTVAGNGASRLGPASGVALELPIAQPFGVEIGPDGALYICEVGNHRVLRLDRASGQLSAVAGNGEKGSSGDGGPAHAARLDEPYEIRFDGDGDLYVVEMRGCRVRRVERATGTITTVAGSREPGFGGDGGPAVAAQLRSPHSIALDGRGGLFIADIGNHRIRRVDLATGKIETIAGNGEAVLPAGGALARGAPIKGPRALHIPPGSRILWIALREGNSIWKLDLDTGRIHHVAGSGEKGYRDGPAAHARFDGPKGIFATAEALWVVDTENQAIRHIDLAKAEVTTLAGSGPDGRGFGGDGGLARRALLDRPHGVAVDEDGVIYIGDTNNHRVRRVHTAPGPAE